MSTSYLTFRHFLLKKSNRVSPKPIYNIYNPVGIKLLTHLRLGFSHLKEHKFNHNFQDCLNPLCSCSLEVESTAHYFLHCHHYADFRLTLLNNLKSINVNILHLSDNFAVELLLYGDSKYLIGLK